MEKIKYIPFNSIEKIELYQNTSKLTIQNIIKNKSNSQYDLYAVTGNFYNTNWKPTCHFKANNVVYAKSTDTYWGYAWNIPNDFKMLIVPTNSANYANHYACCHLIVNGAKVTKPHYNSDVSGTRGRTAIGIKGNELVLYASKDGTSDAKTPEKLRDYLFNKGLDSLIMGDGGGKVNYYGDGEYIQGKEKSQNLFLIYVKKNITDSTNDNSQDSQKSLSITTRFLTNNPRQKAHKSKNKTGVVQHSTGTPGAQANSFLSNWNKSSCEAEAEFIIDDTGIYQCLDIGIRSWHCGGTGNNTHVGIEICEPEDARFLDANWYNLSQNGKNNTTFAVKAVQQELDARGYDTNGIDGIFGSGTKNAVIKFQQSQKLSADGIVGKDTLHALQNRENSFVKYSVDKNQSYFEDVYRKAIYTCGYILAKSKVKTVTENNVLSHAEGYQKGIASNHADVGHWFPLHGKTMDDYREDVQKYMNTGILPNFNQNSSDSNMNDSDTPALDDSNSSKYTTPDLSSWAQASWQKAYDKGIIDGTNPTNPVSREQISVMFDRLKLLN